MKTASEVNTLVGCIVRARVRVVRVDVCSRVLIKLGLRFVVGVHVILPTSRRQRPDPDWLGELQRRGGLLSACLRRSSLVGLSQLSLITF